MGLFSSKPEAPRERSAVAQTLGDRPMPATKEELHALLKGVHEERVHEEGGRCCPEICNKCKKCEGFSLVGSNQAWVLFLIVLLLAILVYYRMQ